MIEVVEKKGYIPLDTCMFQVGNDVKAILDRMPNVIVSRPPEAAKKKYIVKFVHPFQTPQKEKKTLLVRCGTMPDHLDSCLVSELLRYDYALKESVLKMSLQPEHVDQTALPSGTSEENLQSPSLTVEKLVFDAFSYLTALCSMPGTVPMPKIGMPFLVLAFRNTSALIRLQRNYASLAEIPYVEDKLLSDLAEEYAEKRDSARFEIRLGMEKLNHMIRADPYLTSMINQASDQCFHEECMNKYIL